MTDIVERLELLAVDQNGDAFRTCREAAATIKLLREQLAAEYEDHKKANGDNAELRRQLAAERERCAAICDQRSADHWQDYKDPASPFRGSQRTEGMSDEAEECAKAIRAG